MGLPSDGKPKETEIFATGLKEPYGIAFYPPGSNPRYVYIGDTDAVLRFAYHDGDLKAESEPEHIADLPSGGGHWNGWDMDSERYLLISRLTIACG